MLSRPNRRRHRVWAVLTCLLAGQTLVQMGTSGPAAAALSNQHIDIVYSAIDSSAAKSVTITCPAGQKVVSGGGQVLYAEQTAVFLDDLRPTLDGASFVAGAAEAGAGYDHSWQLVGYALCADTPGGYMVLNGNSGWKPATFKASYTAKCPGPTRMYGAGGEVHAPSGLAGLTLVRTDDALTIGRAAARLATNGFTDEWSVTSYAICAYPQRGQQYVGPIVASWYGTADCPAGMTAVGIGGGGGLIDLGPYYLRKVAPFEVNGHTGAAAEMTGMPKGGMVIQATCAY